MYSQDYSSPKICLSCIKNGKKTSEHNNSDRIEDHNVLPVFFASGPVLPKLNSVKMQSEIVGYDNT